MTRDEILSMAREAGFQTGTRDYADGSGVIHVVQSVATGTFLPELERFAALVAERARTEEREVCARVRNALLAVYVSRAEYGAAEEALLVAALDDYAAAIRARG